MTNLAMRPLKPVPGPSTKREAATGDMAMTVREEAGTHIVTEAREAATGVIPILMMVWERITRDILLRDRTWMIY